MRKNMTIIIKDGYTIEKKGDKYTLYKNDDKVIGNVTYKELFWILKFLREVNNTIITR